jgi:hypothetical protein
MREKKAAEKAERKAARDGDIEGGTQPVQGAEEIAKTLVNCSSDDLAWADAKLLSQLIEKIAGLSGLAISIGQRHVKVDDCKIVSAEGGLMIVCPGETGQPT